MNEENDVETGDEVLDSIKVLEKAHEDKCLEEDHYLWWSKLRVKRRNKPVCTRRTVLEKGRVGFVIFCVSFINQYIDLEIT